MGNWFNHLKLKLAGLFLLFRIPGITQSASDHGEFANEIAYYRQIDTVQAVPDKPILFIGSSSVKNWYQFDSVFGAMNCLNRGFGGSTISDILYYAEDVLLKYNPRQIVMYVGENDFAKADPVAAEEVFSRFKELFSITRNKFPEVPIIYLGIKPSPAKNGRLLQIQRFNRLVADFLTQQRQCMYIDTYIAMCSHDGKPDAAYFNGDLLHMNESGYRLWNKLLIPLLIPQE
jgi:lysophospholipase L1-like esterase